MRKCINNTAGDEKKRQASKLPDRQDREAYQHYYYRFLWQRQIHGCGQTP